MGERVGDDSQSDGLLGNHVFVLHIHQDMVNLLVSKFIEHQSLSVPHWIV